MSADPTGAMLIVHSAVAFQAHAAPSAALCSALQVFSFRHDPYTIKPATFAHCAFFGGVSGPCCPMRGIVHGWDALRKLQSSQRPPGTDIRGRPSCHAHLVNMRIVH